MPIFWLACANSWRVKTYKAPVLPVIQSSFLKARQDRTICRRSRKGMAFHVGRSGVRVCRDRSAMPESVGVIGSASHGTENTGNGR
jgi:hypothetical protein